MLWKSGRIFRVLATAAAIVTIAAALGLCFNALRAEGLPLIRAAGPGDEDSDIVTLERAKRLYDAGVVFVDSRTKEEFEEGHIRGARHIYYAHAEQEWEGAMAGVDWDREVVVYCSGEGCNSSYLVAETLRDMGFTKVLIFHGGWPEWSAAGYPLEGKPAEVKLFDFGEK